ncbi:hypothetical protein N7501_003262 [Penicillium viridicatum]|nr:hypothetical protein N7501_003262 [Penicillium viridicatum]
MNRLRPSLLSPSPKGFPDIGELDNVSHDRQDTRQSLARGEFQEVRGAAWEITGSISQETEGTVYNDLPFIVTDMTDFWINNYGPMSGTQRLNFASYLAKVASTRLCKDRMCQVALIIFHCAFEQRQEIPPSKNKDEEDSHRSMGSLELRHLLPASHAWFVLVQTTIRN